MCGIFGVVESGLHPLAPDGTAALLRQGIAALHHRGPDGAGTIVDGPCGLAHARLSIVDLEGGAQPMRLPGDGLALTFNGEIFNHVELRAELAGLGRRFTTRSDTEVILHAYAQWGDACVDRFNGQWAFALWDAPRQRLFCARDRVGVRPFFWSRHEGYVAFASEVKALFAVGVPRALDVRGLHEVITFWCARAPRTVWQGVQELPPGHTLVVDADGPRVRRAWQLSDETDPTLTDDDEVARAVRATLTDATRLRLRADVPVGAYLSGGLDSSLIAGAMAQLLRAAPAGSAALQTFSVAFDAADFDESTHQLSVATALGTEHHTKRCSRDDLGEALPDVAWHAETPLVRTAPAPMLQLARLVRERGLKVVLTGEGADELFGGYDIFREAKVRRFCARAPTSALRPLLFRRLYPWMPQLNAQPAAYLRAFFLAGSDGMDDPLSSHLPRWRLTQQLRALLSPDVRDSIARHDPIDALRADLPPGFAAWDPLLRAQWLETTILLPGYILSSQGDRMAMAHGVEGRFPFLDVNTLALAARLPARMKVRRLEEKVALKRAARGLVPAAVLERPKQPYRAPGAGGLFASANGVARAPEELEALLAPARLRASPLLDADAVGRLIARARRGAGLSTRDDMGLAFAVSMVLIDELYGARFEHRLAAHTSGRRAAPGGEPRPSTSAAQAIDARPAG